MSFLDSLMESTKHYESPKRFYYFAGLSAVSAVLKDRVWFDMAGNYKIYPNIYVLLYALSGARKGPPISLAQRIVSLVDNTRVINGRATIEAIIKELGTMRSRQGKEPLKDSCGFIVASELSSSIISNPSAMDIMTDLYDRIYNEGAWEYKLKVGDSVKLTRPTITWLSGTNEALFKDFLPEKNILGGFIGRMYMIAESKSNRFNSLMFKQGDVPDASKLANMIRPLTQLEGEFKMDEELRHEVDNWYVNFMEEHAPKIGDETGFVSRILDFVIKNAMLISSARRGDLILSESDLKESWDVTLPLIVPAKKSSTGLKKGDASEIEKRALILGYIANHEGFYATRQELLKNLGLRIDHEDLDKVVNLMLQMDVVTMGRNGNGNDITYTLNMKNEKVNKWVMEQFKK